MWKVIKRKLIRSFIAILLIANLGFGYWILLTTCYGLCIGLGFLGVLPIIGILAIIDFIAVLSYIITQRPQGMARDISYTALTPISLVLMYVAYVIFDIWCGVDCI
jgi:hypothetical protein